MTDDVISCYLFLYLFVSVPLIILFSSFAFVFQPDFDLWIYYERAFAIGSRSIIIFF